MNRKNGDKTGRTPTGQFGPGNPGRPRGARHRVTEAVEALLEGEAEKLTRKAVEKALEGDTTALRLCLERIAPARREAATPFTLPPINGPEDHPAAIAAVLEAMAAGDLTTSEAEAVSRIISHHLTAIHTADMDERLRRLEEAQ